MAGIIDNMKDKMSGAGDEMSERKQMLMSQEQDGTITDQGREELNRLRHSDSQGGQ